MQIILDSTPVEIPDTTSLRLVDLLLKTDSMDTQEKLYWFEILPSMTEEQIDRLFDILETERIKLEELELKYQEEIKELNEKHLKGWQEFKKLLP